MKPYGYREGSEMEVGAVILNGSEDVDNRRPKLFHVVPRKLRADDLDPLDANPDRHPVVEEVAKNVLIAYIPNATLNTEIIQVKAVGFQALEKTVKKGSSVPEEVELRLRVSGLEHKVSLGDFQFDGH